MGRREQDRSSDGFLGVAADDDDDDGYDSYDSYDVNDDDNENLDGEQGIDHDKVIQMAAEKAARDTFKKPANPRPPPFGPSTYINTA